MHKKIIVEQEEVSAQTPIQQSAVVEMQKKYNLGLGTARLPTFLGCCRVSNLMRGVLFCHINCLNMVLILIQSRMGMQIGALCKKRKEAEASISS